MTRETAQAARDLHEDTRSHFHALARHEREIRARERRRIAALVGPGHNFGLAVDAPANADPRYDNTGFSDGLI